MAEATGPRCWRRRRGLCRDRQTRLDDQREDILKAFPHTRTLISFVVRMNREAIRTPARSVSNTEFHHSGMRSMTLPEAWFRLWKTGESEQ
jgi:hypothetical protein